MTKWFENRNEDAGCAVAGVDRLLAVHLRHFHNLHVSDLRYLKAFPDPRCHENAGVGEADGSLCSARRKKWSIKWGFSKLNKITSHKLYNSVNVPCSWSRIILATDNIFRSPPLHKSFKFLSPLIWFRDGFFASPKKTFHSSAAATETVHEYRAAQRNVKKLLRARFSLRIWDSHFPALRAPKETKAIWLRSHTLPTC